MKIKIIMMSVFAVCIIAMLPSIQAIGHDTAVEAKEKWIEENSEAIQKLLDDTEAQDGFILGLVRLLLAFLRISVVLAIKITAFLLKIPLNILWLLQLILPPYNIWAI